MASEGSSDPPPRGRPVQAEQLSVRLPTVITVAGAIIGVISGSLVAAGVASHRLGEAERTIAEDRRELQTIRDTVRDLRLGQTMHAERIDAFDKAWEKTKDVQAEQGELLKMMCINANFKAHAGLNCWGKK